MCYECHGTPESTIADFKELITSNNYRFEEWNTTSVNHLIIAMSGHDGPEAKWLAIHIFKQFLNWYDTKKNNYFPKNGMEQMYSRECLNNILKLIEQNPGMSETSLNSMVETEISLCRKNTVQVSYGENNRNISNMNRAIFYIMCFTVGVVIGVIYNNL